MVTTHQIAILWSFIGHVIFIVKEKDNSVEYKKQYNELRGLTRWVMKSSDRMISMQPWSSQKNELFGDRDWLIRAVVAQGLQTASHPLVKLYYIPNSVGT